jgi:hypothetical protein
MLMTVVRSALILSVALKNRDGKIYIESSIEELTLIRETVSAINTS